MNARPVTLASAGLLAIFAISITISFGIKAPLTIAANSEGTKDERIEKAFFIVEPNQKQLTEIARLLDAGRLQCFVDAVVPLVNASDAYCGTIKERHGRGKVVLSIAN